MLRILTKIRFAIGGLSQAFACALLILSLCALGQPLSAAVPDVEDEDRTDMSASNSFELDVPSVLIRNWYTSPDKKPFFSDRNRLLQGWSVVGFWSPQYPFTPSKYSSFEAKGVGAGIIKDFGKSHALRLSGSYFGGDIPASSSELERYMGSLDYLWNFTNTWFGFNPGRSLEYLLVAGGSFGVVKSEGRTSHNVWQGQLGLQVRKTLSPHLSAFVEPYYYVSDPDYDYYQNGADFDDGIGVRTGLLVRVTGPLRETPWFAAWSRPVWYDNLYVQNLLGFNFAKEKGLTDRHDISEYHFNLNVGHWVSPAWGYQVGFADRQLLFKRNNNRRQTFGRLEGVLNVATLWDQISVKRLGMTLSGGAELGYERKYSSSNGRTWDREDGFFSAMTGAAQLKYYINSNTALVAEGRYSSAGDGASVITPSVGLEYYRSRHDRYGFWRRSAQLRQEEERKQGEGGNLFLNNWNVFFETAFGMDRASNISRYNVLDLAPSAELGLGLRLNDLHSVRLKEHVVYHKAESGGYPQFQSETSLDYLFDVTNFWMGLDQYRRFTLRPFVGAVYSISKLSSSPYSKDDPLHSFAFDFGFQNSFRLNSNTEIFIEPRYLYALDDFNQWNLSAGIGYTIERRSQVRHLIKKGIPDNPPHFYIQVLGGMQIGTGESFTRSTVPSGLFNLTFGRSFSRNLGIQATLFQQNASPNDESMIHRLYGIRGEVVADALGMLWTRSHEQGWVWTLQGGGEFTYNTFADCPYSGLTGATQLRRRIGRTPFWATVESRIQVHFAKAGKMRGKAPIWSAAAGIHYELPSIKLWNKGQTGTYGSIDMYGSEFDNLPGALRYLNNWSVQLAGSWFDAEKAGVSVAVGYDFDDVNSLRVGYDFAKSSQTSSRREEINYNSISADYMLDLTNLLLKSRSAEEEETEQVANPAKQKLISRLSVRPYVGFNIGVHSLDYNKRSYDNESKSWQYTRMTDANLGLQAGLHVNYLLTRHLGLFFEQRMLFLVNDPYLAPDGEHNFHALSYAGLKYSF
jgi:hypothetical protein